MTECALVVFGRKKRKYSSYQGENTPASGNLLERDFHAEAPNIKWLTDITEFRDWEQRISTVPCSWR